MLCAEQPRVRRPRHGDRRPLGGSTLLLGAMAIAAATAALFFTAATFDWLNWDDQVVFAQDAPLQNAELLRSAFTATLVGHFQPLAWLAWGALGRVAGLTPLSTHTINIVLHALCGALVFALAFQLCRDVFGATVAALLFAVHPLRVEVVAWASAMPYALALVFALASLAAFDASLRRGPRFAIAAVVLFAASLLTRPAALGLPVAAAALLWWRQPEPASARSARATVTVMFALAAAAALFEFRARPLATVADVSIGARLTLAATAPVHYLREFVVPARLTPLDAVALAPQFDPARLLGGAAIAAVISLWVWRRRRTHPAALVVWGSYLALLAPVFGLVPTGLQATADRYTYLPDVALCIGIGAAVRRRPSWATRDVAIVAACVLALASLAAVAIEQLGYWRNSVALWTRAVELDPDNDVATYNLASALAARGRRADAIARYDEVLARIPSHADARRNRDLLQAAALEDDANALAASGRFVEAIARYQSALALDPQRTHSQSAIGIALVQSGRPADAVPYLREAIRLGAPEAAVANALAFALVQDGRTQDACAVLRSARERFPADDDLRRNLEQMAAECGR